LFDGDVVIAASRTPNMAGHSLVAVCVRLK